MHSTVSGASDPRVVAILSRLSEREPIRVAHLNWNNHADAYTGTHRQRSNDELTAEAVAEVAANDAYAASPAGRHLTAMHDLGRLGAAIVAASVRGISLNSRGLAGNAEAARTDAISTFGDCEEARDAADRATLAAEQSVAP